MPGKNFNTLIGLYSSGEISKEKLIEIVRDMVSQATVKDEKGNKKSAMEYYKEQGQKLRDAQVEKDKAEKPKN